MEDNNPSKNVTPEEIEQQKPNLERQDEKIENHIGEDNSVRLSGITDKIEKKNRIIEETKDKINDIRTQLGLPPSDEIPLSVETEQGAILKLNQEKGKLTDNNLQEILTKIRDVESRADIIEKDGKKFFKFKPGSEDEIEYKKLKEQFHFLATKGIDTNEVKKTDQENESEEFKKFKGNLKTICEDISTQSKIMLSALYERQQNQLTPLQSNEQFQGMVSYIKNITNFEGKFDLEAIDKINETVNKLSRLFSDVKLQPIGRQIKENSQNLEKLSSGARIFSISCQNSSKKLPIEMEDKSMEEKSKKLRLSLEQLSQQVYKLAIFASKLRENI
jgi:hypothetical protein